MKRILASTCAPMLLSLLLVGACASSDQADLAPLEAAQQDTHREVVAIRAQLEALDARLDKMQAAAVRPRHVSKQGSHPDPVDADANAKLLDDNIRSTGEWSFEISRSLGNTLLADPMPYLRARIVPSIKSGKANGFKLYAMRPGSLLSKLGFVNGDTLHSVNGNQLSSPDKVLESYSEWRTASTLAIEFTRRGQPETMTISISG